MANYNKFVSPRFRFSHHELYSVIFMEKNDYKNSHFHKVKFEYITTQKSRGKIRFYLIT